MAARTVRGGAVVEGADVVLGAFAAEFVVAARADGFLGRFVADAADEDVLAAFGVLFEDEVGVVGDLAHLHDETEDVGVVVQHHTAADVGIELADGVRHDAGGEVALDFAEEFIVDDDFFWGKLHGCSVVALHAPQHNAIGDETKFAECFLA